VRHVGKVVRSNVVRAGKRGFMEKYMQVKEALESKVRRLADTAVKIADAHREFVYDHERRYPGWENESRLQLRVRQASIRCLLSRVLSDEQEVKTREQPSTHISKGQGALTATL
jgi:hypothetical protein